MSNAEISSKTVVSSSERNDLACNIPDLPVALTGPEAIATNNAIVVCGGTSVKTPSRRQKNCYQLTKPTNEWKPFPEMKTERYRFHMIYLNGKIWAVGGWAMGNGNWRGLNSMDVFDYNSMAWTNQSIPFNIYYHCLSKIDEFKFILTGGTSDQSVSNDNLIHKCIIISIAFLLFGFLIIYTKFYFYSSLLQRHGSMTLGLVIGRKGQR